MRKRASKVTRLVPTQLECGKAGRTPRGTAVYCVLAQDQGERSPGRYDCIEETGLMVDRVMPIITHTVAVVLVVASVALAAGSHEKSLAEERFEGTVTRVDSRGGATIKTTEGREYTVQAVGLQV